MARKTSAYILCRLTIAFVWLYHGIVPKLLGPHEDELAMNMALGLTLNEATWVAYCAGVSEVVFAACVLIFWKQRWPLQLSAIGMIVLLAFVAVVQPVFLMAAFNPVSTNLSVLVLSLVANMFHGHIAVLQRASARG